MLFVYRDRATVEYQPVQKRAGVFGVVNPDYEQIWDSAEFRFYKRVSRNTRNGIAYSANVPSSYGAPATARFSDDTPVKFFKDLQLWVHALCSENSGQSEADNKKDFASMFRDNAFMSNFAGTWTRADYVNENGLPPEIQLQPMSTGGNLLKVIGETTFRQLPHYIVEAINPNVEFRRYHPSTHPWLFFRPTISVREWIPNGKGDWLEKREYFNEPFDDYGENAVLPVFGFRYDVRSSTKYTNIILKSRVRVLGATEPVPNPYRLRFGRMKPNPYAGF